MDLVLHRLALGNAREGRDPPPEITALLCVAEEIDLPPVRALRHQVPIRDMQPIPAPQLAEAVSWISEHIARERILVFCNAGVGRSSSVVVAYLCCRCGYGFGEAVEHVARCRPHMSILPELLPTIDVIGGRSVTGDS